MKLVKLYHVIAIAVMTLITVFTNIGLKEQAIILGFGVIVILILGVMLMIDSVKNKMDYLEKKVIEVSDDVTVSKAYVEFIEKILRKNIDNTSNALEVIKQELNNMKSDINAIP